MCTEKVIDYRLEVIFEVLLFFLSDNKSEKSQTLQTSRVYGHTPRASNKMLKSPPEHTGGACGAKEQSHRGVDRRPVRLLFSLFPKSIMEISGQI